MSIYHESLTPPDLKELLQRKQFLEKTQSKLEARLAKAPDGRLATSRQSRYSYASFYHVSKDGNRVYLDQSQKETIAALAQKEYDRKALKVVKEELMRLKMVLPYVKMQKLEDVYDRCLSEKRSFITPIVLSDEEFRQRWLSQAYVKKQPLENDHPFPTEKGDIVCSKTEAQEADYMFYHSYDYLYEKRLQLLDRGRPTWRYPDFTILDPVTREEVIFEHFGMVDDEGYQHSMFDKIRLYEENGYVIGQNFLFTFETAEHPFTMDQFILILKTRFPR